MLKLTLLVLRWGLWSAEASRLNAEISLINTFYYLNPAHQNIKSKSSECWADFEVLNSDLG